MLRTIPSSRAQRHMTGALSLTLAVGVCLSGCKEPSAIPSPDVKTSAKQKQSLEPDPALRRKLAEALVAKGANYKARTRHVNSDGSPKFTNRLVLQSSPYLQQHAHNPVQWMPWGEEAFELAQRLGRPIFLSVGYSTCHWCHVMEEESFEDPQIAKVINELYVPIKVDREERPDVDALYMTAVQIMTGRGGWPMSVWLTPDQLPFFGGTYFPARDGDRGTRRGFLSVLTLQSRAFLTDPASVGTRAQELMSKIAQGEMRPRSQRAPTNQAVKRAVTAASRGYDSTYGGGQRAPKFPSSFPLQVLLRNHSALGDKPSLQMATHTLKQMASGGIYDHVGGGFHRYSTDARWLVPHFEKMLYDNALLSVAYLEGYQATGDRDFATVARETMSYVLTEMTSPEGAFYSATDADSLTPSGHREEGYYFTWTPQELTSLLSKKEAELIRNHYQVSAQGNFEGRSILHARQSRQAAAQSRGVSPEQFDATLNHALGKLRAARALRPGPLRDDKIQVSWNGLMLGALAKGGIILSEPHLVKAAQAAADFLLRALRPEGKLRHSYTAGQVSDTAFLDDYTFLASGLLDVFEATSKRRYLDAALELMREVEVRFVDAEGGGYFATALDDGGELLLRQKPRSDRAIPNGNSYALMNQLRLHSLTTDDVWRERAERILQAFGSDLSNNPMSLDVMLLGLQYKNARPRQVVVVLPETQAALPPVGLQQILATSFSPHKVTIVGTEKELNDSLRSAIPWVTHKPVRNGLATAYVCEQGSCELPTTDPEVFARQLAAIH